VHDPERLVSLGGRLMLGDPELDSLSCPRDLSCVRWIAAGADSAWSLALRQCCASADRHGESADRHA
jgi:hypothetical protein